MTPTDTIANLEKRTKILEAARRRMMHYGVSKTTMSEIAEDAQVAVGTIYLYFKNKDEIVVAIAQACREEQDHFLQEILNNTGLTASQKLETFFREKFNYIQTFRNETPHGKELMAYFIQNFPDSVDTWEQRFERAIATILDQGVAQGAFLIPDVPTAACLMRLATMGFFPPPYLEFPKEPRAEDLMMLVQWFIGCWRALL